MIKKILFFSSFTILLFNFKFQLKAETVDSTIIVENQKAVTLLREGRYEEAEKQLKYVLDLKLLYWSEDYQNLGNTYLNLGVLYREFFQYEEAITAYDKAEEFYKQSNKNNSKIVSMLNNRCPSDVKKRL